MTSKDLGQDWSKKVDMYMDMAADLTNQDKEGFKNRDASGPVKHAFKESAGAVVSRLLGEGEEDLMRGLIDVAAEPSISARKAYLQARRAWNRTENEGYGGLQCVVSTLEDFYKRWSPTASDIEFYGGVIDEWLDGAMNGAATPEEFGRTVEHALSRMTPPPPEDVRDGLVRFFSELAASLTESQLVETIKAAAVKTHDGTVFTSDPGGAHIGAVQRANLAGKTWDDEGLGFVTHDDKFVTREEAELIGLKNNQFWPNRDPVELHASDFLWMEGMAYKPYHFETSCVSCEDVDALSEMIDMAQDVTYQEFFRNVPLSAVFDSGVAYVYYWTPAQCVLAGVPYEEVRNNRPLTLKKDWHVGYSKSTYQGKPCYFITHSAIEYVFVKH